MKRVSSILLVILFLAASCDNNKKETGGGKEKVEVPKKQDPVMDEQQMKDSLEKMTPLSLEQFTDLVPGQLMGAERTHQVINSAMGANLAIADYGLNDSTTISLSIYDCAGPAGAGIYSTQYLSMINSPQESDEEYSRVTDLMGGKAIEHCEKENNYCTLSWFTGGRFLVMLEGQAVSPSILKQAARALNIK